MQLRHTCNELKASTIVKFSNARTSYNLKQENVEKDADTLCRVMPESLQIVWLSLLNNYNAHLSSV